MLNVGSTCKSNLEMNLDGFGGKRSHEDFMLALFPVNADQRPEGKLYLYFYKLERHFSLNLLQIWIFRLRTHCLITQVALLYMVLKMQNVDNRAYS